MVRHRAQLICSHDVRLQRVFATFEKDGLQAKITPFGLVFLSDGSNALYDPARSPSAILIPGGDFDAYLAIFELNITLHRLGCLERFAISCKPPSALIRERFFKITGIREDSRVPFNTAVTRMIIAAQAALWILDMLPLAEFDGFLGDMTVNALEEFFKTFGPFNNVDPPNIVGMHDLAASQEEGFRVIDPNLIAALLRTLWSLRTQLSDLGFTHARDGIGYDFHRFLQVIRSFQKAQGLRATQRLDKTTRARLEKLSVELLDRDRSSARAAGLGLVSGGSMSNAFISVKNKLEDFIPSSASQKRDRIFEEAEMAVSGGASRVGKEASRRRGQGLRDEYGLDFFMQLMHSGDAFPRGGLFLPETSASTANESQAANSATGNPQPQGGRTRRDGSAPSRPNFGMLPLGQGQKRNAAKKASRARADGGGLFVATQPGKALNDPSSPTNDLPSPDDGMDGVTSADEPFERQEALMKTAPHGSSPTDVLSAPDLALPDTVDESFRESLDPGTVAGSSLLHTPSQRSTSRSPLISPDGAAAQSTSPPNSTRAQTLSAKIAEKQSQESLDVQTGSSVGAVGLSRVGSKQPSRTLNDFVKKSKNALANAGSDSKRRAAAAVAAATTSKGADNQPSSKSGGGGQPLFGILRNTSGRRRAEGDIFSDDETTSENRRRALESSPRKEDREVESASGGGKSWGRSGRVHQREEGFGASLFPKRSRSVELFRPKSRDLLGESGAKETPTGEVNLPGGDDEAGPQLADDSTKNHQGDEGFTEAPVDRRVFEVQVPLGGSEDDADAPRDRLKDADGGGDGGSGRVVRKSRSDLRKDGSGTTGPADLPHLPSLVDAQRPDRHVSDVSAESGGTSVSAAASRLAVPSMSSLASESRQTSSAAAEDTNMADLIRELEELAADPSLPLLLAGLEDVSGGGTGNGNGGLVAVADALDALTRKLAAVLPLPLDGVEGASTADLLASAESVLDGGLLNDASRQHIRTRSEAAAVILQQRVEAASASREAAASKVKAELSSLAATQKAVILKLEEVGTSAMKARYGLSVLESRVSEMEEGVDAFVARVDGLERRVGASGASGGGRR
ncbi:hypothetical protein DFJ73DRAFT_427874 [Zopfochytrium polystomum]|nr:hypothetical protein DFJ73DRAFT_427874 [Zopfochytrium polystomum]